MTLPATSVHSCHYKLHIKKLKYSSTHCSPICRAALLIEGSQLHQFVFLIRRFLERFLSNLWQHGTRQIYGNMGPVKFMATWDPPNLWQHGTRQIYVNMGPVKFMATWDLSNLWQHGTCQIYGNMGPTKFMATWDPSNLWQHGTRQIYGNMGPVKFMATWDLSNFRNATSMLLTPV